MRFVRCRLGDASQQAMDGIGLGNSTHSIIDHTSISWTIDESTSSRQSGSVGSQSAMNTFQHNIISEPLRHSYHYNDALRASTGCTNCYQEHAFAASISGEIASYHHNLIAHSTDRNWSLAGGLDQSGHLAGSLDIRNNVVYNWKGRTTDGGVFRLNYVNNYYKSCNSDPSAKYLLKTDANDPSVGYGNAGLYYMVGNVMNGVSGQADLFPDNWANGGYYNGAGMQAILQTNAEIFPSYMDTQSASNAYKVVLSDSGCNMGLQDLMDKRVIGEVLDRTTHYIGTNGNPYIIGGLVQSTNSDNVPGFIDSQTDVKDYTNDPAASNYSPNWPWPPYYTYNVAVDTDHDGLPDWWERIKGLNTNSPAGDFSDANIDLVGDGYTELERYLTWLALPHYDCTNNTTLNVDLTQYTRGFTNVGPTYAVFGAIGGSVVLNGRTAQFTPNTGVDSLGSFLFTVTDNTGFSYTNSINVHIFGDGSVTNAPAAPTGLNATPGNTQVALSWTAVSGATSYHVWRSTTSGSGYVNIATTASSTYTDTGLVSSTTYYYVVSALNFIGESTNSAEASATPSLPLPAIPTGLTAAPGNGQVTLSWSAASGATSYYVKRSTTSGSGYVNIATNVTTGLTDATVTNGTTYYYVVSGVNSAGQGTNSAQASATPQIPAPTGLGATAGNGQVALSWNASVGATAYIVKRSTTSGSGYVNVVTNGTTTYTNTGLANAVTYYFVVSALGANGESTNSTQVSATPVSGAAILVVDPPSSIVSGSGTSFTTPVMVSPGANALVVLIGDMKETSTTAIPAVTWNGQTLTNAALISSGSTGAKSSIFYLYNPATDGAAHNLSCTFTAGTTGWRFLYYTLSGVNISLAPLPGSVTGGTATISCTVINCPPNGLAALNAFYSNNASAVSLPAYGSGILNALYISASNPTCAMGYANYIAAGTDTFSATTTLANGKFAFTAAVFTPAGAVGNTAPTLPVISNRTINVGYNLSITNNATDSDTPAQTLSYSLITAVTNATINTNSGVFSWRPLVTQANTTNTFSVVVADNGSPSMSATQSFSVVVNPLTAPSAASAGLSNGLFGFAINGQSGPDYGVQASTNLVDWSLIFTTNSRALPFNWTDPDSSNAAVRFYRVKLGPPLP
jgi:fibronectin type 3 domain-containing protein